MKKNPAKRRIRQLERTLESLRDHIDAQLDEQEVPRRIDEDDEADD